MSDDPYNFLKELDAFDRGQPTPIKQSEGSSDNEHRVSTYSLKTGGKHSLPYKVYTENANSHSPKKENNDDKDDK